MRLYLAGPMRGIKDFNFPAFFSAAEQLRAAGHEVFNPAEKDRQNGFDETRNTLAGFDLAAAMRADLQFIVNEADGIALLPHWQNSSGASLEMAVAKTIGLRIFEFHFLRDPKRPFTMQDITDNAEAIVHAGLLR